MSRFPPLTVVEPTAPPVAVLVDSPHSGMEWPDDFAPVAPREAILTTWDAFVDELWSGAPTVGATLIAARFPRAYIDANRAESDLDLELLAASWPVPVCPTSYSDRGMGLIRRLALPGVPMYDRRLTVAEVERRIADFYAPYRDAVSRRMATLHERFGRVVHLNAHSMKSRGNAMNVDVGAGRPDVVVSDRLGTTAHPAYTQWVADWFRAQGMTTQVNDPYQGGDIVASEGAPDHGRHSIQVEFNRALYMDEAAVCRGPHFAALQGQCTALLRDLAGYLAVQSASSAAE